MSTPRQAEKAAVEFSPEQAARLGHWLSECLDDAAPLNERMWTRRAEWMVKGPTFQAVLAEVMAEQVAPDPALVARVEERIDNLLNVAARFDHQGGSRRLAQRARDKADGMESALRLLGVCERGVFGDPVIHRLLTSSPGESR